MNQAEPMHEVLRVYPSTRLIPEESLTAADVRAYRRGVAAYKRGDYITLKACLDGTGRRPRRASKKGS